MKLTSHLSVIAASTIMLAALPLSAFAATKVSQKFNWDFMYFPQTTGGIVFSGGNFYESSNPTVGDWSTATIDAKTVDGFSGTTAVTLKHHVYAIGGANVTFGMSIDMDPNQIWSMKSSDPTALHKVKELATDSGNQFRSLVKYRGDLFASDSAGNLWRSINGTHWHQMNLSGLPDNTGLTDLVAGANTLYAFHSTTATIYTSNNGKGWTELTGSYNTSGYLGRVESFVEFSGHLYVLAADDATGNTDVWKVSNTGNFTQLFEKTSDTRYILSAGTNALYLTGNDGTIRTLNDNQFTLADSVTGQVQSVVKTSGQDLFVVNNSGNISLWK